MYLDYIREKTNKKVLEIADKGFATYEYTTIGEDKAVYIEDIYVIPELRETGLASEIANKIYAEAKELGCTYAVGSVNTNIEGTTVSMKVLMSHGMEFLKIDNELIWFYKGIWNGRS